MTKRRKFPHLQTLALERGYGLSREGRRVAWWRNEDPSRRHTSSCVSDAWEDIVLDHSSKEQPGAGTRA